METIMRATMLKTTTAAVALLSLAGAAGAQTMVSATTDLNIRSGPGPHFEVVGVIGAGEEATVEGCLENSKWCKLGHDGTEGWAYSDYLAARFGPLEDEESAEPAVTAEAEQPTMIVLTERPPEAVPVVVYEPPVAAMQTTTTTTATTETVETDQTDGEGGAVAGAATGAVAGALIAGPVGAAIGSVAGAITGGTVADAVQPPEEVVTYVTENRVEPVYLSGEVVVGAGIPENVEFIEIPEYEYDYVYVNHQPVLVDPESREIVYVIR